MGSVAKSYMRKGFLIYCMRKCTNMYIPIYKEAASHMIPSEFPYILYEENLIFFLYQCRVHWFWTFFETEGRTPPRKWIKHWIKDTSMRYIFCCFKSFSARGNLCNVLFLLFWGKIFQRLNLEWYRPNLLGHKKKIAKFLMRTFTCRSTFFWCKVCYKCCLSTEMTT